MQQIDANRFQVNPGEIVSIDVDAHGVGREFAVLSVDGAGLCGGSFTVTKTSGNVHFGLVDVTFPPGSSPQAFVDLKIRGSMGGGTFAGPRIANSIGGTQQMLRFEVV